MRYLIAAEAPNGVHLAGDTNEIIWGSIAFFTVVGLLVKFAGPAAVKAFRGRTERIQSELADAKAERAAAESALNASSAELPDLSQEEDRIRSEAVASAARLKTDLVARAQAEADDLRARGAAEVENYRRQSIADLAAEVSQLTKNSAEAVVVESLDAGAQGDLIDSYINQVEQLS